MDAPAKKKPTGPRDFVGEQLEAMSTGKAQYESVEDLLLKALMELSADEEGGRMRGYHNKLRGLPDEAPMAAIEADADAMPPECEAGECDHPEHQREDALPDDFEG